MTTSLNAFKRELRRIRPFLDTINWEDEALTSEKAYVAAVFSKIAYLAIPDFELRNHRLAKIIPCLTYRELIASGTRPELGQLLLEAEISNDVFVDTSTNYVAAVIIKAPSVIIIALRGTRPLYISDWMIDLHISKTLVSVGRKYDQVRLHSGFFLAITSCLEKVGNEVQARTADSPMPVYIVGHSLGGAMAAIAFALDGLPFGSRHRFGVDTTTILGAHSSYCYGMPRYGDDSATQHLRTPFHMYNSKDVVPTMPPRWLGFSNVPNEHWADGPTHLLHKVKSNQRNGWRGVRHHMIERYIRHLGNIEDP